VFVCVKRARANAKQDKNRRNVTPHFFPSLYSSLLSLLELPSLHRSTHYGWPNPPLVGSRIPRFFSSTMGATEPRPASRNTTATFRSPQTGTTCICLSFACAPDARKGDSGNPASETPSRAALFLLRRSTNPREPLPYADEIAPTINNDSRTDLYGDVLILIDGYVDKNR
jgi:hypothetical protein